MRIIQTDRGEGGGGEVGVGMGVGKGVAKGWGCVGDGWVVLRERLGPGGKQRAPYGGVGHITGTLARSVPSSCLVSPRL